MMLIKNIIFLGCIFMLGVGQDLPAQNHDVSVSLVKDNIANCTTNANSDMYAGDISKDFLRFVRIPALQDGHLRFEVTDFIAADDVLFMLKNEEMTSATYGLRLNDFEFHIEDVNGQMLAGTFQNGDVFRIIRCKNSIIYMQNEQLIHCLTLADNDFRILGEMFVDVASEADVRLQFESL